MGKSKKKAMHSQKEEQQAKKVMMTMGVIAIVLVIAMFVTISYVCLENHWKRHAAGDRTEIPRDGRIQATSVCTQPYRTRIHQQCTWTDSTGAHPR